MHVLVGVLSGGGACGGAPPSRTIYARLAHAPIKDFLCGLAPGLNFCPAPPGGGGVTSGRR